MSRSVTTMERCASSSPREIRCEMIPTGMKWVQTVMSGRNLRMNFTSGIDAEPVQPQPELVGLPRFIALLVHPAEQLRRGADQLDVELRVEIAEQLVRVDQRVLVLDGLDPRILRKGLCKRLRRLHMPGARACRENQYALFHLV